MGRLKILASGTDNRAKARARGKLFEKVMSIVLRQLGYTIDQIPNSNYAGMEIDIEGRHIATGIPVYAECKCYETAIDSPKVQAFAGKYMAKWFQDKKAHGLLIAIPSLNSHAKAFFREYYEGNNEVTVSLCQENDVVDYLIESSLVSQPSGANSIIENWGYQAGEWTILYTDKGCYLAILIGESGSSIPSSIALFSPDGQFVTQQSLLEYIKSLDQELQAFELINKPPGTDSLATPVSNEANEIVEVRGSSACFEYQFPAAPRYFVGREETLQQIEQYIKQVARGETSSRGLLFEAASGWGKSSCILACVNKLLDGGDFAVAIDSRTASSSQFILGAIQHAFRKFRSFGGPWTTQKESPQLAGFESATRALLDMGEALKKEGRVLIIVFDQFENVFFQTGALTPIRDLLLKLHDAQSAVVLGFSWKTDLLSMADTFPWRTREAIADHCRHIGLTKFAVPETNAMLDRLRKELRTKLRADLQFLLSEFSQGYPWLLKKLCAHVIAQRSKGQTQQDIANNLLNMMGLFEEDLSGLTPEEEDILRRLARVAPISVRDLGDDVDKRMVETLVNRRLIVRIGSKLDIYWDVFRDFLVSGSLPVQGNYMLRVRPNRVLAIIRRLCELGGKQSVPDFLSKIRASEKSFFNVWRDLRLFGFASLANNRIELSSFVGDDPDKVVETCKAVAKSSLQSNRLSVEILQNLGTRSQLSVNEVSKTLMDLCPYISASDSTWRQYSLAMMDWLDLAELAIYDSQRRLISAYTPGRQLRERNLSLLRRGGGGLLPSIQYNPVKDVLQRLKMALTSGDSIDWQGLAKSTIRKSLLTLEDLGYVVRGQQSIMVTEKLLEILYNEQLEDNSLAKSVMALSLYRKFIEILREHQGIGATHKSLAKSLIDQAGLDWKPGTGETNVKIMLDWARHTSQAPGEFARSSRSSFRKKTRPAGQTSLPLEKS